MVKWDEINAFNAGKATKAYDVLGLPLYDEYFFLSFKAPKYFDAASLKQTMANLGKEYIKLD